MVAAALFLLLLIMILVLPLRLRITADGTERIHLCIFFWKFPIKRLTLIIRIRAEIIPYVYLENKKLCTRIFPKKSRRNHRRVPLLHAVLKAYRTEKLHMNIVIGVDDAALTAYSAGAVRTAIGLLLPKLRLKDEEKTEVSVDPHFAGKHFSAKGECIIYAVPANIIRKMITRKGGKKHASH